MRLRAEQLEMHLQRTALEPIYFVSGDEPLQKLECVDQIRVAARAQGYDERIVFNVDKSFDWYLINQATDNLSLFSNRRIIELRMASPKPGKEGGRTLLEYVEQINKDNLLIISSEKIDKSVQNTKWFKAIERRPRSFKFGLLTQHNYLNGYKHVFRLNKNGSRLMGQD